jgi:uncharacterized protein with GYD domain
MATFISFLNWTEQGAKNIKDAPQRAAASRRLLRELGGELKAAYMTSGDTDVVLVAEVPNGDAMAKFALALASQGNVRTRTVRAWTEPELTKIISELP